MTDSSPSIPYGYCGCGCGGKTNLWTRPQPSLGRFKGEPTTFLKGHHVRLNHPKAKDRGKEHAAHRAEWEALHPTIPYGTCWCGCGERTTIAKQTNVRQMAVQGAPNRYIRGHVRRRGPVAHIVIDLSYESPCWIWQRSRNSTGYGVGYKNGRNALAHRVYYEEARGPIPEGCDVHHLCGIPACVNPDHLEALTRADHARESNKHSHRRERCSHCDGVGWV